MRDIRSISTWRGIPRLVGGADLSPVFPLLRKGRLCVEQGDGIYRRKFLNPFVGHSSGPNPRDFGE